MKQRIRKLLYKSTYFLDPWLPRRRPNVFVLCYHSIASDNWRYSISWSVFKKQVEYLVNHYQPITLRDVEEYINGNKEITEDSFALTFDDGYANILSAINILNQYHIQPTVFVISSPTHANRKELDCRLPFLTISQIHSLVDAEWTIGCHGATHSDFNNLTSSQLKFETVQAKLDLEKIINQPVRYFAFPKGRYNQEVLGAVGKAGFKLAFSMDNEFIYPGIPDFTVSRVGVDGSHSFPEFQSIFLPSSVQLRRFITSHIGVIT